MCVCFLCSELDSCNTIYIFLLWSNPMTSWLYLSVFVLNRGGRKPLGFLSLICKKSRSESAQDTKGNRGKIQKPRIVTPKIVTPKRSLKKPTPSTKDDRESCSLPSTSTSSSVEYENVAADAAVMVCVYFERPCIFEMWRTVNRFRSG